MKTVTVTEKGQTITATLNGNNLVLSDPHAQLITFAAERLPALRAALDALDDSQLVVLQLAHKGTHRLHVFLAAASEMSFEVEMEPGADYDALIADLCRLAPALLRLDRDLMEMNDGGDAAPRHDDQRIVRRFIDIYGRQIKNARVGLDQFAGLEGE